MKNKNTALLFACFTGFFTYLYTYNHKKDMQKFWVALALSFLSFGLAGLVFSVFAIIETINRDEAFYKNLGDTITYNNNNSIYLAFKVDDEVLNIKIKDCLSKIKSLKDSSKKNQPLFEKIYLIIYLILFCVIFLILSSMIILLTVGLNMIEFRLLVKFRTCWFHNCLLMQL